MKKNESFFVFFSRVRSCQMYFIQLYNYIFKNEIATKSKTVLIIRVVGSLVGFLFTLLLARLLGNTGFGQLMLTLTGLQILSVFVRIGLDNVIVRNVAVAITNNNLPLAKGTVQTSRNLCLFLCVIVSLLFYIGAPFISSNLFNKPDLADSFKLIVVVLFPYSISLLISQGLRGAKDFFAFSLIQNIVITLNALLLVVAFSFFTQLTVKKVLIFYAVASFSAWLFGEIRWSKIVKNVPVFLPGAKEILKSSLPLFLTTSGSLLMTWSDTVILGRYETITHIGQYNAAVKLTLMTSLILTSINAIAAPRFAELYSVRDFSGLRMLVQKSTKIMILLAAIPTLFLLIWPQQILSIFGDGFEEASFVLVCLTLGQFVNVACGSVGNVLNMTGHEKHVKNVILTTAFINIAMSLILVQIYGMEGVAIATMMSIMVWNIWLFFLVKKHLNFYMISY